MVTLETDSANVRALNIGRIVAGTNSVDITELISKATEDGYSPCVVGDRDSTETPATYANPRQLL